MQAPTLVLLPGLDGSGLLFQPLLQCLPPDCSRHVISYPAHTPLSYAHLTQIAHKALPKKEPYFILGESFSGPIAMALAAQASAQPSNCLGLILCCSFVHSPRPHLRGLSRLLPWCPLPTSPWAVAMLAPLLLGRWNTPSLSHQLAQALAPVTAAVLRQRLHAVATANASAALAQVQCPVLYLRAQHDQLVPQSAASLVQQIQTRTELVELDAPHGLLQAVPEKAAPHLLRFMGR